MDQALTRVSALAPSTMRRLMAPASQTMATRNYHTFHYPHSHSGTNNSNNNRPVTQVE